ncbi:hypothetical protein TNCT_571791 [Trichonephila clavata]|uniref:Uncharacterized protein n=1 Tax=Trichonephila clavata TaxID=2740835 RepID=A0A8X6J0H7_TRICU|nr:hypothetical protein TNCT_571791 [Trichonephila clavata]
MPPSLAVHHKTPDIFLSPVDNFYHFAESSWLHWGPYRNHSDGYHIRILNLESESHSEDDMISESLSEDDATAELEFIPGTMEQLIQSLLNSIHEEDS